MAKDVVADGHERERSVRITFVVRVKKVSCAYKAVVVGDAGRAEQRCRACEPYAHTIDLGKPGIERLL